MFEELLSGDRGYLGRVVSDQTKTVIDRNEIRYGQSNLGTARSIGRSTSSRNGSGGGCKSLSCAGCTSTRGCSSSWNNGCLTESAVFGVTGETTIGSALRISRI